MGSESVNCDIAIWRKKKQNNSPTTALMATKMGARIKFQDNDKASNHGIMYPILQSNKFIVWLSLHVSTFCWNLRFGMFDICRGLTCSSSTSTPCDPHCFPPLLPLLHPLDLFFVLISVMSPLINDVIDRWPHLCLAMKFKVIKSQTSEVWDILPGLS